MIFNIILKVIISDINKSLNIKAPTDSVSIEKLMSDYENRIDSTRMKGKSAALKSNLSAVRAQAELIYDETGNSYGKNPFTLGPCKKTAGTLFANTSIASYLEEATDNNMSTATCVSKGVIGNVASYAVSAPLPDVEGFSWCVDSTGNSKQIIGVLKSDVCK